MKLPYNVTCRASHTYNVTMVSTEHRGQELLQDPVAGEQVDAHCTYELLFLTLNKRLEVLDARIVNDERHITHIVPNTFTDRSDLFTAP